jgi:hypothetical protein
MVIEAGLEVVGNRDGRYVPPKQPITAQMAPSPMVNAFPGSPTKSHVEKSVAFALMAITQGPSRRPPNEKSSMLRVKRAAMIPTIAMPTMYMTKVIRMTFINCSFPWQGNVGYADNGWIECHVTTNRKFSQEP